MILSVEAYDLTFRVPPGDTAVGASLQQHGEFARPELELLLAYAEGESGVFLDVGGNIGAICLPFSARRPNWSVRSFEPSPFLSGLLSEAVEINGLTNLSVIACAVGEADGRVRFPDVGPQTHGNFGDLNLYWPADRRHVEVPMTTLDAHAAGDVRLVKVDVQGHEAPVLRGAQRLLRDVRPVWLVEATEPERNGAIFDLLRGAGYQLFWFYSPFATPQAPRGNVDQPFKGDAAVLALPEGAPNIWDLTPVQPGEVKRPQHASAYPYLARYGYSIPSR